MRIEESQAEILRHIGKFESTVNGLTTDYEERGRWQEEIRNLTRENGDLKSRIATVEFKASVERAAKLDLQEKNLVDAKKLEYNKGYADAYIEVAQKMGRTA